MQKLKEGTKITKKNVPKTYPKERSIKGTLLLYNILENGGKPSDLYMSGRLTENQVKKAITELKYSGSIKKIGYAKYELLGYKERSKKQKKERSLNIPYRPTSKGGYDKKILTLPKDYVRGHAFWITLKIPKINNWKNRNKIMKRNKINFTQIPQGQSIYFNNFKVWLCNESIVFITPKGYSWFAENSRRSKRNCAMYIIDLINKLEKYLKIGKSLKINGCYHIKFSRQHYALIKNDLAKDYNDRNKKLYVSDWDGQWLIIDFSHKIDELETINPKTSDDDNVKVQKFFNKLRSKEYPENVFDYNKNIINELDVIKKTMGGLAHSQTQMFNLQAIMTETLREIKNIAKNGILKGFPTSSPQNISEPEIKPETKQENNEVTEEHDTENGKMVYIETLMTIPSFMGIRNNNLHTYPEFKRGTKIWIEKQVARILIQQRKAKRI